MSRIFFGFCRKLVRTKTQQGTDKASKHNGRTVFSRFWYCLRLHQQEWCQLCLIVFILYLFYFYIICANFFLFCLCLCIRQSTPPPIEYAPPLVLGRHAKAYDRVSPQPSNEADTKMTMYPAVANLSYNHRASGEASIILSCRLQQRPPPTLSIIFQASTVSGIKKIFYSLLLLFTSSFAPMLLHTAVELGS